MMRIVLLLIGIAVGVGAMLVFEARPVSGPPTARAVTEHEDDEARHRRRHVDGAVRIELTGAEMELADIRLGRLAPISVVPEQRTVGRVANSADLLTVLRELRAARTAAAGQQAVVATLGARLRRLRGLSARGEISIARELAGLEVEYRREVDVGASRTARIGVLETALLGRWGSTLARTDDATTARLSLLEAGKAHLIEFNAAAPPPSIVYAAAGERREDAGPVQVLGPAAAALGAGQGASFFGLSQDTNLRAGMALTLWIPENDTPVSGLLLPASAVVWHHGSQWYYVAAAPGSFERRALGAALAQGSGFVLPAGEATGAEVVLRGGQLLLAEEFRAAIPEEDDD